MGNRLDTDVTPSPSPHGVLQTTIRFRRSQSESFDTSIRGYRPRRAPPSMAGGGRDDRQTVDMQSSLDLQDQARHDVTQHSESVLYDRGQGVWLGASHDERERSERLIPDNIPQERPNLNQQGQHRQQDSITSKQSGNNRFHRSNTAPPLVAVVQPIVKPVEGSEKADEDTLCPEDPKIQTEIQSHSLLKSDGIVDAWKTAETETEEMSSYLQLTEKVNHEHENLLQYNTIPQPDCRSRCNETTVDTVLQNQQNPSINELFGRESLELSLDLSSENNRSENGQGDPSQVRTESTGCSFGGSGDTSPESLTSMTNHAGATNSFGCEALKSSTHDAGSNPDSWQAPAAPAHSATGNFANCNRVASSRGEHSHNDREISDCLEKLNVSSNKPSMQSNSSGAQNIVKHLDCAAPHSFGGGTGVDKKSSRDADTGSFQPENLPNHPGQPSSSWESPNQQSGSEAAEGLSHCDAGACMTESRDESQDAEHMAERSSYSQSLTFKSYKSDSLPLPTHDSWDSSELTPSLPTYRESTDFELSARHETHLQHENTPIPAHRGCAPPGAFELTTRDRGSSSVGEQALSPTASKTGHSNQGKNTDGKMNASNYDSRDSSLDQEEHTRAKRQCSNDGARKDGGERKTDKNLSEVNKGKEGRGAKRKQLLPSPPVPDWSKSANEILCIDGKEGRGAKRKQLLPSPPVPDWSKSANEILCIDDHPVKGKRYFSAYLCVALNDLERFGCEFHAKLEYWGYRIFLPVRDLLARGNHFDNICWALKERCNEKIIIILSKNFENSDECRFITHYARALDPDSRKRNLIPVSIEPDSPIPNVLVGINIIKERHDTKRGWLKKRLAEAIAA
ncbi:inositol 1,4,5-trisphosphate receptor [Plakobranchus ocellatus]|uniref:Inositol 1,4,5-trisphosphate receptor n=1 Tax=Plakobranchus ocellatus TaxID=259542 RepID=A0AAV3Y1Z1_9GAST|nr:inositol 1,4,5-trisphosphate receptor [Plakobranchus ocellatus]